MCIEVGIHISGPAVFLSYYQKKVALFLYNKTNIYSFCILKRDADSSKIEPLKLTTIVCIIFLSFTHWYLQCARFINQLLKILVQSYNKWRKKMGSYVLMG